MQNIIVLATHNQRKLVEFQACLSSKNLNLVSLTQFNVSPVEENGLSFVENAIIKARYAAKVSGLPAVADDSGIVVPCLKGAPGIYSARYAGENASDQDNLYKLLHEMKLLKEEQRKAFFHCAIVYVTHELDPIPMIYQGVWHGSILEKPQGETGFGYDPIFYVPSHHCSAAQLSVKEKNRLSHRGKALRRFMRDLFSNTKTGKNFT